MDFKKIVTDFNPKDVNKLRQFKWVAEILVIVGGLNWLLVGLLNVNLLSAILGGFLGRLLFIIVGLAACLLCYFFYEDKFMKKNDAPTSPDSTAK